jgi:broad specificity phosphatase PhoE
MSDLYFIRHGQASFGADEYDKISDKGDIQSGLLAEYLYNSGIIFDTVYSGTLERQKHTANRFIQYYADKNIPLAQLKQDKILNEYNSKEIVKHYLPIVLNEDPSLSAHIKRIYTDKRAFQILFNAIMQQVVSGKHEFTGMESWKDFKERVRTALNKIMAENGRNKKAIIFSSGGPIAAAVQLALNMSDEKGMLLARQIVNTSITRFKYNEQEISLHSLNSYPHLELYKAKDLITFI